MNTDVGKQRLRDDVVNGYVLPESTVAEYGHADRNSLECLACRKSRVRRSGRAVSGSVK